MEDDQKYLRKLMEQYPNRLKQQSSSATLDTAFVHGEIVPANNPETADGANDNTNGNNNNNHNNGGEFPPGYRFCPLDGELVVHYLRKQINKEKLPHERIKDVNLYQANPAELAANYEPVGDKEWYFFTPRERKYRNGSRPNRAAGAGYWKATGADKPVRYNGEQVGYRKALVYYEGRPPKGDKTNWIMHEYTTNGAPRTRKNSNDMRLDDWVLCRIYHKDDKATKNQRRNQEPERVQCPTLNNNDQFPGTDSVYNGMEDLSEPINTYGDIHRPGYPNAFPGQNPHLMDSSFANLANYPNNGGFQQPFISEARPINMMPPFFSGGSALSSKYLEEAIWDSNYTRGFQETFWGSRNPYNFQASSQFDIPSTANYVDPYLNLDNLVGNNPADDALSIVSNNPPDDPLDIVRDNPADDDPIPSMPTED